MELPKKVLIVGLGKTGVGLARFLDKMGVDITITDIKKEEELKTFTDALKGVRYKAIFGGHRKEDFLEHPLIIVSPGVDTTHPFLIEAIRHGNKVTGEIEFSSRFIKGTIIAVTGTNGKTTVTSLLGEIFREAFGEVFVGGNIGNPLINYLLEEKTTPYIIIEVSSFQLETIERFRPSTALLLNITEDHLDRYRTFKEYMDAKLRLFENQKEKDHAILNKGLSFITGLKAKRLYFSAYEELNEGAFFKNGMMYVRVNGKESIYKRSLSPLIGVHNTENILSALLVAHIHGIDQETIEMALKRFNGLPHRVEYVGEINGIRFYDDSKATNVDATKMAIEGMEAGVIIIAGGKDKGGSYKVIKDLMKKVKAMVVIGEARQRIKEELGGYTDIYLEEKLEGAVKKAYQLATKGDVILLSPMCSSFDMFKDYKERGDLFKTLVRGL